jgi:hypothetical protein
MRQFAAYQAVSTAEAAAPNPRPVEPLEVVALVVTRWLLQGHDPLPSHSPRGDENKKAHPPSQKTAGGVPLKPRVSPLIISPL